MKDNQGGAVGGSVLGGVIGGVLRVLVGGAIGSASFGNNPTNTPLDLIDPCLGFFGLLIGVGIGGVIGAIGGSAIGAGIATQSRDTESGITPDTAIAPALDSSESLTDSTEAELIRLRQRVAELEERKRREEQR
jgi:hypothetical protein